MKPNISKSLFFLSIGICVLLTFLPCFADSASAEFSKRKQITLHASKVIGASPLIDFPVMIELNGSQFQEIENDIGPNGYDIEFRASDETTPLTHEIEIYDESNDLLVAWVKISSLSTASDTVIYMYYGDSAITSPTHNPPGVWNSTFGAVWHLKEDPALAGSGGIRDSTGNNNHGTDNGGMNSGSQIGGPAGNALSFDGIDDYLAVPNSGSIDFGDENFTISFWIKGIDAEVPNQKRLLEKGTSSGGCGAGKRYEIYASGDWDFKFTIDDNSVKTEKTFSQSDILNGSWHYAQFIRDAGSDRFKIYIDGSYFSEKTGVATSNISNGCDLYIANQHNNSGRQPKVSYDEFRIINTVHPDAWIQTEFNNQDSPSTFYTVGIEEGDDTDPPSVTVTTPTSSSTYSTNRDSLVVAGVSSDNVGVTGLTWTNSAGGSGTCSGTIAWNAVLPLSEGDNVITVTASDEAGNQASDVITVTYDPDLADPDSDPTQAQCDASMYADYSSGFDEEDLELLTVAEVDGKLVLQTGSTAIDLENIVIPYDQEVWITYIHSGAGFYNDFGWMLKDDAVDGSGNFLGYHNIPLSKKHGIFRDIRDGNQVTSFPDGILDVFEGETETFVSNYDDNTGYPFIVDWDGTVGPRDHKKSLGVFAGGTEIVFFLAAYNGMAIGLPKSWEDPDWDNPALDPDWVFYNKRDWNADTYDRCEPGGGPFNKLYQLDQARPENNDCYIDGGWLDASSITRLTDYFNVTLAGTSSMSITPGQIYPHAVVGAPADDPKQWVIGFEDVHTNDFSAMGLTSDMDHNDIVIHIERRTGGTARLKSDQAITPPNPNAFFTAVTLSVYDKIEDESCLGENSITYFVSLDAGANWVEITSWDRVMELRRDPGGNIIVGDEVADWSPGSPAQTYRTRRLDFAGLGLTGRELVWKAVMTSDDDQCVPEIFDIVIAANVAERGTFSRAAPVVLTNVLYSGNFETPAAIWTDKVNRGHLTATRIYDPKDPNQSDELQLWDAGLILTNTAPSARTIYFPDVTVTNAVDEVIATADGTTKTFSGRLANYPVLATTLTLTDQHETFEDKHTTVLEGNLGGTGSINRFTGDYTITFKDMPGNGVTIKAGYSYYTTVSTMLPFTAGNITNEMLGLDDSLIIPQGYVYDLNGDDNYTESDGDWLVNWIRGYKDGVSTPKEWLLGPIDHSAPAVITPPGIPSWHFGTDTTDAERTSYTLFKDAHVNRPSVIFVGSLDGMLHAFDAGKFRHGDNPETADAENRGYFLWEDRTADYPPYCSDDPSACPDYGTGEELWAFIPANLLPRFKNNVLQGDDRAYVDASPALADVNIGGTWTTVLLSAEGVGGDTVFALDVTDPTSPTFLWEFADPDLFRSRSSPSVSKIGRIFSEGAAKWVAFFVSGKTEDAGLYPSIYMLDVADGNVVERIVLDAAAGGVGGVPSGQPTVVDSDGNGYLDRIYIGTDKGLLYKVNIPDNPDGVDYGISHCVINLDFTDEASNTVDVDQRYHPIYGSPVVMIDNQISPEGLVDYDLKIFFGTGDSPYYDENINMAETQYHFFAYRDQSPKGECDQTAVSLDWFFELPPGHRIFASAFAAAGQIYFGTSTADTEDPCESLDGGYGLGKIFAFGMDGTQAFEQTVGNIIVAPLVQDEHVYIKTQSLGLQSFGDGEYNNRVRMRGFADFDIKYWREIL